MRDYFIFILTVKNDKSKNVEFLGEDQLEKLEARTKSSEIPESLMLKVNQKIKHF